MTDAQDNGEIERGDLVAYEPDEGRGIADGRVVAVIDSGWVKLDNGDEKPINEVKVVFDGAE